MSSTDRERLTILIHEVKSSVAALAAIAETFAQARQDVAASRQLVQLALAASRMIERVVSDAAIASVRREQVDVTRLVEEAVAAAVLRGGNVRSDVAAGLPLLHADPLRLRQALDNLVSNALIHARGEVIVGAQSDRACVLVAVTDTGPGVPLEEQERIFDKGVRLDSGLSGSGLGLAVARAIAEAHEGTLTVKSAPGEGATFTMTLPVR